MTAPVIYFDARMLSSSGIGTYIRSLLVRLVKEKGVEWRLLGKSEDLNSYFPGIPSLSCDSKIYSFQEQIECAWKGRRADLYHAPHYNAPLFVPAPLVVTVHDLTHFRYPEFFGNRIRLEAARLLMGRVLKRAAKIIAISQATARDLQEHFQISPQKIRIVYEGPGVLSREILTGKSLSQQRLSLPASYLLYVGNLKPHKNILRLIKAFCELKEEGIREDLVIVGKLDTEKRGAEPIRELLKKRGVYHLDQVTTEELAGIYSKARGLVFPSLWEGFGLPILEAYQADIPVICSRIPSHEEIGGSDGYYFDPYSLEDVKTAVSHLVNNSSFRQRLIQNGRERLKLFSWDKTARETIEVYREVLGREF